MSGIIAVMAGMVLFAGIPGFAEERQSAKAAAPPTVAAEAKPAKSEPVAAEASEPVVDQAEKGEGVSLYLKVPFYSPYFSDVPLATVNDEIITLADLQKALMAVHEKMTQEKEVSAKKAFIEPLQRLINARLVVLEAKNIELDKLPEIKESLTKNAEHQLRQALFLDRVKGLKPDEKEVEKEYRESIKEIKLKTIMFQKESDAKKFELGLKGGKNFDELSEQPLKEGRAEKAGRNEELFANNTSLGPIMSEALAGVKAGSISPIIPISGAFVIAKIEEIKFVENPALKEKARGKILSLMRMESLKKYKEELARRYLKENTKLIKSVDFEAKKPGFKKLLTDKRVLVIVKGEKPITVADLANAMYQKFFHGVDNVIKEKRLNREKLLALDEIESLRVFRKAALEKGLDKSEEYLQKIEEHKNSLLFGTFVEKVVKPEVTFTIQELKDYYEEHGSEYTYPEMLQIEAIAFTTKENAQTAIDKLRQGMDLKWLKNNADGQVAKNARDLMQFDGQMLSVKSLPEPLQKVLSGARKDDYKLYESPEGYYYALLILNNVPEKAQPLEEVKDDIAQKVTGLNLSKKIDEWFEKLREAYPVKIYLEAR
ncbi:MAG: peptidyl-prolyl cis-trans isomerase [Geobacteraceae bacterium]